MLNAKQKKLIPLIIKYGSVEQACKAAKVDRTTYYKWLKIDEFKAELKTQQDFIYANALIELKNLNTKAVETYRELLNSNDESIKFRAASAILECTNKLIEGKELKERIETIEKTLENMENNQ